MDNAFCLTDGHTYTAVDFERLPAIDLEEKRKHLVCVECRGPGFFRKRSRSGQAACFGARPHRTNCGAAAADAARFNGELGPDQDELINPGRRIVLDLEFGAAPGGQHIYPNDGEGRGGRGSRFLGSGARPDARMIRRLKGILRNLINVEGFSHSTQELEIPGYGGLTTVRDFFVPFNQADEGRLGTFGGFWGMVTDARNGQGAVWINSGGRGDVSVCLPEGVSGDFFDRFHVEDNEAMAGAYVLVIGRLVQAANGKVYIRVEDLAYITAILAR